MKLHYSGSLVVILAALLLAGCGEKTVEGVSTNATGEAAAPDSDGSISTEALPAEGVLPSEADSVAPKD